jgi:hypothetical protein
MSSSNLLSTSESVSALQTEAVPEPSLVVTEPHSEPSPSEEVESAIPNPKPLEVAETIPAWQIQFLPEFRRTHPEHRCIW